MPKLITTYWRRVWLFFISLSPGAWLAWRLCTDNLGPEPAKTIVISTGIWAVNFLVLTLCVTPAKRLLKIRLLSPHRRMLGLFCWFYACLHMTSYSLFILGADFQSITYEFTQRPFIAASIPAWLILCVLAITSPQFMKRLCGKSWVYIHRCVYLAAILIAIHIAWQVRASYQNAVLYGVIIFTLLLVRMLPQKKSTHY